MLILTMMLFHVARHSVLISYKEEIEFKLFTVSFVPWIYMFLTGVLFQKNFRKIHSLLSNKGAVFLFIYLVSAWVSDHILMMDTGNGIHPILFLLLALAVFSCAYSLPELSKKILKGNDISYGVYIYHIPVINVFIFYGFIGTNWSLISVISITIIFALFSWILVEKPSMRFKSRLVVGKEAESFVK